LREYTDKPTRASEVNPASSMVTAAILDNFILNWLPRIDLVSTVFYMLKKKGIYLVVDTEATSLDVCNGGIIQIGAVVLDKDLIQVDTLCFDIQPPSDSHIDPESLKVNGFTQERIDLGLPYKESCAKLKEFIDKNFENQPITVGHFYPFDWAYIVNMFGKNNKQEYDAISKYYFGNKYIDTKALVTFANCRAGIKGLEKPFPSTSLSNKKGLRVKFGIDNEEFISHDALGDAMITAEVLRKLVEYDAL
jgi:DNA polymerase III epsilon subunit-like protein